MATASDNKLAIGEPFTFPNGVTIKNRLVKSAMAEGYQTKDFLPDDLSSTNYARWAQGGWGMVITGNYMTDPRGSSGPGVLVVNNPKVPRRVQVAKLASFARTAQANGTRVLGQLCHAGRAGLIGGGGNRSLWEKTMAPSPIPQPVGQGLFARGLSSMVFGVPKEMTYDDIETVIGNFASAAEIMADAGFDGIELHGAHGYLLSQFLSAGSNHRTDEYGGDALARTRFVTRVIKAVRAVVPAGFIVGIKLNSVDYQTDRAAGAAESAESVEGVESERQLRECIEQFAAIAATGVDFVEVSGGSLYNPVMSNGPPKSARSEARESFFLAFAETFRASFPDVPLMVTGGFHSRTGMEEAVSGGGTDLIGVGRASVVSPSLPADIVLNRDVADADAVVTVPKFRPPWYLDFGPPIVGLGYESVMYGLMIQDLGTEREGRYVPKR